MSSTFSSDRPLVESADPLVEAWARDPGFWGWVTAVNHKIIGRRFVLTALVFFVAGGVMALLMRLQLAIPENSFLSAEVYNQLFTMHGTTMMFLFAVPVLEGVAIYLMPLMLGTRDMPFPRLNAFSYWTYLFGGLFVFSSFMVGQAPSEGWFAYVPLASQFTADQGMDFWLLGISLVEVSGIIGAVELVVGFFRRRSPGMSLDRVPLFAWAGMVTGGMMIVAFPTILAASSLLELERATGLVFFDPNAGGDPLLWQHLFWFFGHPEVYIMLLPAVGMMAMIVPALSRRPIAGYGWVVASFVAIGVASFGLWVHHMFTVGLPSVALAFFSAASVLIAIPSGVLVFSWLATMWTGRPRFRVPLLFVLGFLVVFVIGGITGVMVASVPFDLQAHDSFFVVAHFHYVLIGGVVFPLFAGLYYWFPKWTGRMSSERLGRVAFWTMLVGVNVAFFPQHFLGLQGMPRRVFTYEVGLGWELGNLVSTVGAFVLAGGILVALYDLFSAWRKGAVAPDNPWDADSLEWATSSPPPAFNFRHIPVVASANPLWDPSPDQSGLDIPDWLHELAYPEQPVREVVDTSPVTGEVEGIARLPGGSSWPILTALSLLAALLGVLGSWLVVAGAGLVATLACLMAWASADPDHAEHHRGASADGPNSSSSGIWGLGVGLVSTTVVLGSLVFAYWQLAGSATEWPPDGAGRIGVPWLLLSGVMTVAAMVAIRWRRGLDHEEGRGQIIGVLFVAALLSVGSAASLLTALAVSDIPVRGSAYGSAVATLIGAVALLALAVGLGLIPVITRLTEHSPAAVVALQAVDLFAIYVVGAWIVVTAVLLLGAEIVGPVP